MLANDWEVQGRVFSAYGAGVGCPVPVRIPDHDAHGTDKEIAAGDYG